MTVLLDTNIIIEHLRLNTLKDVDEDTHYAISVITLTELLRYPGMSANELQKLENFLNSIFIISIDSALARQAALLGRTRKTKLPDLIIAASALQFNIPLITKNIKDFRKIPKLIIRTKP